MRFEMRGIREAGNDIRMMEDPKLKRQTQEGATNAGTSDVWP